jgi:hypothetical protein
MTALAKIWNLHYANTSQKHELSNHDNNILNKHMISMCIKMRNTRLTIKEKRKYNLAGNLKKVSVDDTENPQTAL